jgi:hypothetical protein
MVAISCIGCHTFGTVSNVKDVVRNGALGTEQERRLISQRFPPQEKLAKILNADKRSFPDVHGEGEPYRPMIERINRPLDLQRAAAEGGTKPEVLEGLIRSRKDLRLLGLSPLLEGTVTRKAWQSGQAKRVTQLVKEIGR